MMSLLRLLPSPPAEMRDGTVMFGGQDLLKISRGTAQIRGSKIGFIFQDPMTSLNPVYTVGFQLAEPLRAHMGMTKAQARTLDRTSGTGRHP
jgi:oligopeptide transport system ATP-binding protein